MNNALIRNWNERVKPEDTVYHIGDFCFKTGREGSGVSPLEFETKLNGKIIHILGNHDRNNTLKNSIFEASIFFDKKVWKMRHKPNEHVLSYGNTVPVIYLCGHVHDAWKFKEVEDRLFINVGCDVWNYRPISSSELIRQVSFYANKINKKVLAC